MSEIIREVTMDKQWCVLRCDNYTHTFAHVQRLVDAAWLDFPDLDQESIWVKVNSGMRQNGQLSIEFQPTRTVPSDYKILILGTEPSYN